MTELAEFERDLRMDDMKVMVVDDNPDICIMIQAILDDEPITVITASGGKECIKELEEGFSGLIILDVMMPDMDGWDTIREIIRKDLYHRIIICMLTAMDKPDEKMLGIEEYVSDFITKPIVPDALVNRIRLWMENIPVN